MTLTAALSTLSLKTDSQFRVGWWPTVFRKLPPESKMLIFSEIHFEGSLSHEVVIGAYHHDQRVDIKSGHRLRQQASGCNGSGPASQPQKRTAASSLKLPSNGE